MGVPKGIKCAPLIADLCLLGFERDFMLSLSGKNQADVLKCSFLYFNRPISR